MRDSLSYIKNEKPVLFKIIAIVAMFNLVISPLLIIGVPVLIIDILKMSDELLGFTQGMLALGGLCGGILTALLSKKLKVTNSHILLLLCSFFVGMIALFVAIGSSFIFSGTKKLFVVIMNVQ